MKKINLLTLVLGLLSCAYSFADTVAPSNILARLTQPGYKQGIVDIAQGPFQSITVTADGTMTIAMNGALAKTYTVKLSPTNLNSIVVGVKWFRNANLVTKTNSDLVCFNLPPESLITLSIASDITGSSEEKLKLVDSTQTCTLGDYSYTYPANTEDQQEANMLENSLVILANQAAGI